MDGWIAIGLAVVAYGLLGPALGIAAFARVRRLETQVWELHRTIKQLQGELSRSRAAGAAPTAQRAATPQPTARQPAPEPTPQAAPESEPEPAATPEPAMADDSSSPASGSDETIDTPPAIAPPPRRPALEERLTSNWLVWLGGVTLAVGGFFLVRYLADRNLLGPLPRIVIGLAFGGVLVAAGEWLRRRPLERSLAAIKPTHIPAAVSGAGIFTMFVTGYLAFQLYGMIPPALTFVLLAGIAALAVLLSLLQGPFLAVLGLLGGYVTPALIQGDAPSAAFFAYIFILSAGGLAVVRYRTWWWLAGLVLIGAAAWPLVWMADLRFADEVAVATYLNATLLLFVLVRPALFDVREAVLPRIDQVGRLPTPELVAVVAGTTLAVLTFVLIRVGSYDPASLTALMVFCAISLALARREALLDILAIAAASLAVMAYATWHLPKVLSDQQASVFRRGHGEVILPILPPQIESFALVGALLALLFGVGGFVAFWGARRPQLWAGLSTTVPVVLLVIAFWRVIGFAVDFAWSAVAVALAALYLVACERLVRYRGRLAVDAALGVYASGVTAALSWGLAMSLEQAWLSTALAIQLPAIALIERRLRTGTLRKAALVLATIVLVRLIGNPNILDYGFGDPLGSHWILYGYGLPALSFFAAARLLGDTDRPDLVTGVLQAGALAFATLLMTFELRVLMAGSIQSAGFSFAEMATLPLVWGVIGLALYRLPQFATNPIVRGGTVVLASLSAISVILGLVTNRNPIWSGEPVGDIPIFNLTLLAYGGAAILSFLYARQAERHGHQPVLRGAATFGLALVFVLVSFQVRQLFHGGDLWVGPTTSGEWYAYSAAWLGYAGILLWIGIRRQAEALRHASLAIVMLTVAKVFLFDMSELTGIWRPLSFLGLGLTLIAVAYAYRRFVFPLPKSGAPAPAGA